MLNFDGKCLIIVLLSRQGPKALVSSAADVSTQRWSKLQELACEDLAMDLVCAILHVIRGQINDALDEQREKAAAQWLEDIEAAERKSKAVGSTVKSLQYLCLDSTSSTLTNFLVLILTDHRTKSEIDASPPPPPQLHIGMVTYAHLIPRRSNAVMSTVKAFFWFPEMSSA